MEKKSRPQLPSAYQKIYADAYKSNRQGKGLASYLAQKMESWMHKEVAKSKFEQNIVLELGAGTLNHYKYESSSQPTYDIVEPFTSLYQDASELNYIRSVYSDISMIPNENKYDRIISIATYEHVLDLDNLLVKSKELLKSDGLHVVAIPNEGHFMWTMGWFCTTGLAFRLKHGLDYSVIMKHEHVNTANEIENLLNYHYKIEKCNVFGVSKKLCLYRVYTCSK
jgi:SAM-dependent methyltransferase